MQARPLPARPSPPSAAGPSAAPSARAPPATPRPSLPGRGPVIAHATEDKDGAPRRRGRKPAGQTPAERGASPPPPPNEPPPPPPPPPPSSLALGEADPARFPFHARLHAAAASGDPAAADAELAALAAAGFPPGPAAFHAAVIAAARAGDADGALDAMRRAHGAGVRPLPASYVALIRAFCGVADAAAARAVLASMVRATPDARPGWLALCKGLFAAGLGADAAIAAERGRREGWVPDADLFGALLTYLCGSDRRGVARAAAILAEEMPEAGVPPTTAHANVLLRAEVEATSVHEANRLLSAMGRGELGPACRPDTHSYNVVLAGYVRAASSGDPAIVRRAGKDFAAPTTYADADAAARALLDPLDPLPSAAPAALDPWASGLPPRTDSAAADRVDEVVGEVLLGGCLPDATTHALLCEARAERAASPDAALQAFRHMVALGTPRGSGGEGGGPPTATALAPWGAPGAPGLTGPLSDGALAMLLRRLAMEARPWDLLEVLAALAADGRAPPGGSLAPLTPVEAGEPPVPAAAEAAAAAAALAAAGGEAPGGGPSRLLAPLSSLTAWVPPALRAARHGGAAARGLEAEAADAADALARARAAARRGPGSSDGDGGGDAHDAAFDEADDPDAEAGPPPGSYEVDGVLLDADGAALGGPEAGYAVITVSKLTREQLVAECVARDLPTTGTKNDIYRRVQAARKAREQAVLSRVSARKEVAARAKAVAREQAAQKRLAENARREAEEVEWAVEAWEDNALASTWTELGAPPTGEDVTPLSLEEGGGTGRDRRDDDGGYDGRDDEEDALSLTQRAFRERAVARMTSSSALDDDDGGGRDGGAGGESDSDDGEGLDGEAGAGGGGGPGGPAAAGAQEDRADEGPEPWWPLLPGRTTGGPPPSPARLGLGLLLAAERCGVAAPAADLAALAAAAAACRDARLAREVAARLPAALPAGLEDEPIGPALDLARALLTAVTPRPGGGGGGGGGGGSGSMLGGSGVAGGAAAEDEEELEDARAAVMACLDGLGLGGNVPALAAELAVADAAAAEAEAAVEELERREPVAAGRR